MVINIALRLSQWILTETELDNIEGVTLTVEEARDRIDSDELPLSLTEAFDRAQAPVFTEARKRSFILICIE